MSDTKLLQAHVPGSSHIAAQVSEHHGAEDAENTADRDPSSFSAGLAPSIGAAARSINPENTNRACLLILGMHRSGTSAITAVLSFLGAVLPKNVMGSAPTNETGHWEPDRLIEVHDRMLSLSLAGSRRLVAKILKHFEEPRLSIVVYRTSWKAALHRPFSFSGPTSIYTICLPI